MWLTLLIITILTSDATGHENDERSNTSSFSEDISDLIYLFKTIRNHVHQQQRIYDRKSNKDAMANSITGDKETDRQFEKAGSTDQNIRPFVHLLDDLKGSMTKERTEQKTGENRHGKLNLPGTNFRDEKGWGNPGGGVPGR